MKKTKERNTALPLGVAGAVCLISVIVLIVVLCLSGKEPVTGQFEPPAFETAAVQGTPKVPDGFGYSECFQEGMGFRFSVCGKVMTEEQKALVYLTNPEGNGAWLKIRIFDVDGNLLGESGLLKAGEYVRAVPLSWNFSAGTPIKLKVMAYEPETYYSAGSVTLNTAIGGEQK